jgi:hypothetical protein
LILFNADLRLLRVSASVGDFRRFRDLKERGVKENSGAMRTAVARGIVERLAERAADAPDVPALVAFDEAGGENKLNWRELQSSVLEHSAILARRTDRLSDSVVYLQATADLHSAVVILSCLCSGIPVLALTPKATPAEVEDILASVRSGYGEPVHESAAFRCCAAGKDQTTLPPDFGWLHRHPQGHAALGYFWERCQCCAKLALREEPMAG